MSHATERKNSYEIDYDLAPERGEVVKFDGHQFKVVGYEAYVRRDGTSSSLIIWNSSCVDCGEPIEVKTAFRSRTITKRCKDHKRRGVPATKAAMERLMTRRGRQKAKTEG